MSRVTTGTFDEIAEALQGLDGRVTLTGLEQEKWCIHHYSIGRVSIHVGQDGAPNLYEGASESDALILFLPLANQEVIRFDGREVGCVSLASIAPGHSVTVASAAPNHYAACKIPIDLLAGSKRFNDGDIDAFATSNAIWVLSADRMNHIRKLLTRLIAADCRLVSVQAARTAEEEWITLMLDASRFPSGQNVRGRPAFSRQRIISKALECIQGSQDETLYVEDLCNAAGVSERTLRGVFNEYFGIGPIRYLRQRRLHRIRAALLATQQGRDTISSIASGFGVWDFGRFAREYKATFGELPSQTLYGERDA